MTSKPISRIFGPITIIILSFLAIVIIPFLIWRLSLGHKVNARLKTLQSAGVPINHVEVNDWYIDVPEEQNAALVVMKALELMRTYEDARTNEMRELRIPARTNLLTDREKELFSGYLELNRPALAKAQEAFHLKQSRYPVDMTYGVDTRVPHLARMKALATIAGTQVTLADAANHPSYIPDGCKTVFGLAHTLEPEPMVISQLMRGNILSIATKALEYRLNREALSESVLGELASEFSTQERTNLMARALIGERAFTVPYFRMSTGEALRRSADSEVGEAPEQTRMVRGRQPTLMLLTGFFERDQLFYLNVMQTNIALAKLPPPRCLESQTFMKASSAEAAKHWYLLSAMMLQSLESAVTREVKYTASLRVATTAIAVERFRLAYGRLPGGLAELVPQFLPAIPLDPFDGNPLRFRQHGKGFIVYSIDVDGKDEGGRERPERLGFSPNTPPTFDLTFIVER